MVAPRKIRCKVVAIAIDRENPNLPSAYDLLPSADLYVVGLIRKLQNEVRRERADAAQFARRADAIRPRFEDWSDFDADVHSEAELPWDDEQFEYEPWADEPGVNDPSDSDDLSVGR